MKATTSTATSTAYAAAVESLHEAEATLQAAQQAGEKSAVWAAEMGLLRAEDKANDARLAVLTGHAKKSLQDLVDAVGSRALVAHAIFTSSGQFHGSFHDFMQHIASMLTDADKVKEAAASLPASPLRHGSPLLSDDRRAAIRDAMQRQAA